MAADDLENLPPQIVPHRWIHSALACCRWRWWKNKAAYLLVMERPERWRHSIALHQSNHRRSQQWKIIKGLARYGIRNQTGKSNDFGVSIVRLDQFYDLQGRRKNYHKQATHKIMAMKSPRVPLIVSGSVLDKHSVIQYFCGKTNCQYYGCIALALEKSVIKCLFMAQ